MAGDLLHIGASGVRAARAALDQTAHNIANANTGGYVRRTLDVAELASPGSLRTGQGSLAGVRIAGTQRHTDAYRQAEVRRTGADAARAAAQLSGLQNIENAVEQASPFEAVVGFEAALRRLAADPASGAERTALIGAAGAAAAAFNLADRNLRAAEDGVHSAATAGVDAVNSAAAELATVNRALARMGGRGGDAADLLDRRDALLQVVAEQAGLAAAFGPDGQVEARLGGPGGPVLVSGGAAATLTWASDAGGTLSFAVGTQPAVPPTGALSGHAAAALDIVATRAGLDAAASAFAARVNSAQAGGVDLAGNPGTPLFTGSAAGTLAVALTHGDGLAAAPAGAGPQSRSGSNLDALIADLDSSGAAQAVGDLAFVASSRVAQLRDMGEVLQTIADGATAARDRQSAVDLDMEAGNLLRFQQAFQASGRAMQVATDVIDTLLGIGR